ncbi:PR-1 protein, partial [Phakopsora pachyrhizi]
RWLLFHNKVRNLYKTKNVKWSEEVAKSAQIVADTCEFKHSGGKYGENIAAGQVDIQAVVNDWSYRSDECQAYDPDNPIFSHFTQILWKSTTEIGCAIKQCNVVGLTDLKNSKYYVCQYNPPGNYLGQFQANVNSGKGQCIK